MSRLFGWSYPPGCSGPPDDCEGPCEVCGQWTDDCICPECPVCQSVGDPACYMVAGGDDRHGLDRTPEQIAGRAEYDARLDEQSAHYRDVPDYE